MISVAMTTYNGEKFLKEQIDSILNQTYKDIELVVCDDGSTDSTREILKEYETKDKRVRIFFNETNLGFKKNFEKAASLCRGDYIAFSDQDDVWFENHIEFLLNNLNDKSISGANAVLIDSDGNDMNATLSSRDSFVFMPEGSKFLYRIIFRSGPIQGASMLLPKSFIKKCLPIPEKVMYHDAWFLACACLDKGISYSYKAITKYRQHGNNITFDMHNHIQRTFMEKLNYKMDKFFNGVGTDRFTYISELTKRFGKTDETFSKICDFFDHVEHKKVSVKDLVFLWKNYENITTEKGHKHFLRKTLGWIKMRPHENE